MTLLLLSEPWVHTPLEAQNAEELSVLRLGAYRKLTPLNPFEVSDTFSTPLMELVFNRLVRYDALGEFEPDLAKSWKISEDGKTYTFFLREGVKFHDGAEFTAQDVLHSIELASDPDVNSGLAGTLKIIDNMKIVSDYVLEIKLKEPFSPFLLALWRVYIVPKHLLASAPEDLEGFLKKPQGTGPFIFLDENASGLRLGKNPAYFEGAPALDMIKVSVYGDKDQMWSAFLRDELDLFFYLDWKNYLEIKRLPSFDVFRSLSSAGYALIFNLRQPLLQDVRVRKAIAYAINRRELILVLENGQGILMDGPFHPASWAFARDTASPYYAPAKALELLKEAGFTKMEKGMFEKDGEKLVLNLLVDLKNEQIAAIAKLIRQQLYEIGIGVKFHFFKSYDEFKKNVYQQNELHVYLINMSIGPEPDGASRYWATSEKINVGKYSRPEVDELFNEARGSSSRETRAGLYRKIEKLIAEDMPVVFLYYPYVLHAASKRCENTKQLFGPFVLFNKLKGVRKKAS